MVIDSNAGGVGKNRFHAPTSDAAKSKTVTSNSGGQSASPVDAKNTSDSVSLSGKGQAMSQLESLVMSSPDVDVKNVAALKRAIAEGTYAPNPEKIAERMLADE